MITTKKEFNEVHGTVRINDMKFTIISSCGHTTYNSMYYEFVRRNVGVKCKECTLQNAIEFARANSKIDGVCKVVIIEKMGVDLLRKHCEETLEIVKTRETCEADILVRPLGSKVDSWLKVQLKVTSLKHGIFNMHREYNGIIILCINLVREKFWIFDGSKDIGKTISIISDTGKYSQFKVENICEELLIWYNKNIYNITFEIGNTPQLKTSQLEYEFVKHREEKINFITFIQNEMDGLVYDFKIGDKKIQEKVCSLKNKNNNEFVTLHKGVGIGKKQPYQKGDNDFYWINSRNKQLFYLLPESEMIEQGFIGTDEQDGKISLFLRKHKNWIDKFKFEYDTINEPKNKKALLKLLDL